MSYSDNSGDRYAEGFALDLRAYLGTGGITRHGLHDIHKQLEEIAKSIKRWTDYGGIKVLSRRDLKQRRKERSTIDPDKEDS